MTFVVHSPGHLGGLSTDGPGSLARGFIVVEPQRMASLSPQQRTALAEQLASAHGGVVHRAMLREVGIGRQEVRTETRSRRWVPIGKHTVRILSVPETPEGRWWEAVWESGSGAVLDGASALVAQGMTGLPLMGSTCPSHGSPPDMTSRECARTCEDNSHPSFRPGSRGSAASSR